MLLKIPDYIENDAASLRDVLSNLLPHYDQLAIASGYFDLKGFIELKGPLARLKQFRLLLGTEPTIPRLNLSDVPKDFPDDDFKRDLEKEEFSQSIKGQVLELRDFLNQKGVEVRIYRKSFFHAKAYIFPDLAIVGSSNFTGAGLTANSELNAVEKNGIVVGQGYQKWFDKFWQLAEPWTGQFREILDRSKFGDHPYPPYLLYIRALWETYKDDLQDEEGKVDILTSKVELTEFQKEGLRAIRKKLERFRGVIISDSVGLGKTFLGKKLLEEWGYFKRQPCLIICPAQLRPMWRQVCAEINVNSIIESQEQIQRADHEHGFDPTPYHHAKFVIIDESHNFRNDKSGRFANLDQILKSGEPEKHVVLLTATPINNSIWDLNNQIKLITKGDPYFYKSAGLLNLETTFKQAEKNSSDLTKLYNVFEHTMVRRTRQFILKKYPQSTVNGQRVSFPQRRELKETRTEYNIDSPELKKFIDVQLASLRTKHPNVYNALKANREEFADLDLGPLDSIYSLVNRAVLALHCTPYNLLAYKKPSLLADLEQKEELYLQALVGLMKTRFFKRFESSLYAFDESLQGYQEFADKFQQLFHKGAALSSGDFRKMLARGYDEDDITPESIFEEIKADKVKTTKIDPKDYRAKQVDDDIGQDLIITDLLRQILDFIRKNSKDDKLEQLIKLLERHRKQGDRVIVFSYFKDTVNYLHREFTDEILKKLPPVLQKTRFGRLSSDADADTRLHTIWRIAPKANGKDPENLVRYGGGELDVLFSTDVISEGQNLQDVRILINYDLHWNPVRMIQRAGRIDRLNSPHKEIEVWNFFPEVKLEQFLKLIERLQNKISQIDATIGLDSSILGETIHPKDFNHIAGLAKGDSKAVDEIEHEAEIPSDEPIKEDLLDFLRHATPTERAEMQMLPLGIHSGFARPEQNGVFFAFFLDDAAGREVFWFFYDRGHDQWTDNKFEIWRRIRCKKETKRHVSPDTDWFKLSGDALAFLRDQLKLARGVSLAPPILKAHVRDLLKTVDALDEKTVAHDRKQELMDFIAAHGDMLARDFRLLCDQWKANSDAQALLRKLGDLFLKYRIAKQETAPARDVLDINALKLLLGLEVAKL